MEKLNLEARQFLAELLKKSDHTLSLDDFDDILRLHVAAEEVREPGSNHVEWSNLPMLTCGPPLFQPTFAAIEWLEVYALEWYGNDVVKSDIATAYACHMARVPDIFAELTDKRVTDKTLKAFRRRLGVNHTQLRKALEQLLGTPKQVSEHEGQQLRFGPLVALLCREYGASPDYWINDAPISLCMSMLDDYDARMRAEWKAMQKASKGKCGPPPPPPAPLAEALKNRRGIEVDIENKWMRKEADNGC